VILVWPNCRAEQGTAATAEICHEDKTVSASHYSLIWQNHKQQGHIELRSKNDVMVYGPLLGQMDNHYVSLSCAKHGDDFLITVVVLRSSAFEGSELRNVPWQSAVSVHVERPSGTASLTVKWLLQSTAGPLIATDLNDRKQRFPFAVNLKLPSTNITSSQENP
jgi:hypothetical protein